MSLSTELCGLGESFAQFNVYIANRPNYSIYADLDWVSPVRTGEIYAIGQACGNGWRKVFNVYAKLLFALNDKNMVSLHGAKTWQSYRDDSLLQELSNTSLLFSFPQVVDFKSINNQSVHIVMGKTYAKTLNLPNTLKWIDNEFAIDTLNRIIVCPYFDYRQLSNIKIIRLVELIKQLTSKSTLY